MKKKDRATSLHGRHVSRAATKDAGRHGSRLRFSGRRRRVDEFQSGEVEKDVSKIKESIETVEMNMFWSRNNMCMKNVFQILPNCRLKC